MRGTDDALADFCWRAGIACHRGPLEDVAARVLEVARRQGLDAFVRVCGDSPLLDPRLVDRAVAVFRAGDLDLVTNVLPRTFPPGQSVEVVRSAALAGALARMPAADREHVTRYFYRHRRRYRIRNLRCPVAAGGVSLAVDTASDLDRITALIGALGDDPWQYDLQNLLTASRTPAARA